MAVGNQRKQVPYSIFYFYILVNKIQVWDSFILIRVENFRHVG
jgi:hypothetical protein